MGSQDLWKVSILVHLSLMFVEKFLQLGVGYQKFYVFLLLFCYRFAFVCPRLTLLKMAKYLQWHGRSPGCMSMIIVRTNLLQHGPFTSCTKLCVGGTYRWAGMQNQEMNWRQNDAEGKREIKWTKLETRHLLGAFSMPKEKTRDKKVRTKINCDHASRNEHTAM